VVRSCAKAALYVANDRDKKTTLEYNIPVLTHDRKLDDRILVEMGLIGRCIALAEQFNDVSDSVCHATPINRHANYREE
jgi:hypothetical protein